MNTVSIPQFEYQLHERVNGTKFIKILMYINDAEGYVEISRINQSKSHWTERGYCEIEDVYDELKRNAIVVDYVAKTQPGLLRKQNS